MDSSCIKQTVCKVLKIFQHGKYLVAYVLKIFVMSIFGWPFNTGFTIPSSSKLPKFGCTDEECPRESAQDAHALLCIFAGHICNTAGQYDLIGDFIFNYIDRTVRPSAI